MKYFFSKVMPESKKKTHNSSFTDESITYRTLVLTPTPHEYGLQITFEIAFQWYSGTHKAQLD